MLGWDKIRLWLGLTPVPGLAPDDAPEWVFDVVASAASDVGKVRTTNEDAIVYARPADPATLRSRGVIMLVADGMGGANGGSVASQIASQVIPQFYFRSKARPSVALRLALEFGNKRIYRHSCRNKELRGMGTTCVALVLNPPFAWAAWVGDSRLYLVRNGRIFQMTEDHTITRELVRQGILTAEEATQHEERNVVTRALGSHATIEVAIWNDAFPVRAGDRFLLCSDGLHDLLTDAEILELCSDSTVNRGSDRLIERANSRGGPDNISAVLAEIVAPPGNCRDDSSSSLCTLEPQDVGPIVLRPKESGNTV